MARILLCSSWVACGHVGLSAGAPALQALGPQVILLPTTILSNHPGFARTAGAPLSPSQIAEMLDALEANGWTRDIDAVLTGYMPTEAHVELAAEIVGRVRAARSTAKVVVDPILGDTPKGLYLPEAVAARIGERLIPLADVITPNLFELSWLSGVEIDATETAIAAAHLLLRKAAIDEILVTSVPVSASETGVLAVAPQNTHLWAAPTRPSAPKGIGDVFSALVAADLPIGAIVGHLLSLIDASQGAAHLRIAEAASRWTTAPPVPAAHPPSGRSVQN